MLTHLMIHNEIINNSFSKICLYLSDHISNQLLKTRKLFFQSIQNVILSLGLKMCYVKIDPLVQKLKEDTCT